MVDRIRITGRVNPRLRNLDEVLMPQKETIERAVRVADRLAFVPSRKSVFATEGAVSGNKWKPLSDRYAKWKKKVRPDKKILVFDGGLKSSLTQAGSDEHVAVSYRTGRDWVMKWGTSNRLAAYHGNTSLHNPRLPVRDPMTFSEQQENKMVGAVRRVFLRHVNTRGIRALAQFRKFRGR